LVLLAFELGGKVLSNMYYPTQTQLLIKLEMCQEKEIKTWQGNKIHGNDVKN